MISTAQKHARHRLAIPLLFLAPLIIASQPVFGQGLNNEYPVDQTDLRKALELQGIHVFKFPLQFNTPGRLRFVFETYEAGALKEQNDPIGKLIKVVPDPSQLMPEVGRAKKDTIRIYVRENSDTAFDIRTSVGSMDQTVPLRRASKKFGVLLGSRAFDIEPNLALKRKHPLIVLYSQAANAQQVSCPADATPAQIGEIYAWAVVVYILVE